MRVVSWIVRILGAAVALILVLLLTFVIQGRGLATRHITRPVSELAVAPDSSLVPRGEHIASIVCAGCHAPELTGGHVLSGGHENYMDIPNGPKLGIMWAPNVTPGGVIKGESDARIARVIREGVSFKDRPILIMPSANFHTLSDRDVAALVAYLRSQPSVEHLTPARAPNPLAFLMLGARVVETSLTNPIPNPIPDIPEDSSVAYGAYLTPILSCTECHGADYRGGHQGQLQPLGPNLVKLISEQPFTTFELAVRHGVKPAGGMLDPTLMPWGTFANLSDVEVRAVYEFLKSLPR